MRLRGRLAILLALALTLAFGACAEGQTLQAYLDGYAPEGVMVVAYEAAVRFAPIRGGRKGRMVQ